MTEINMKDNMIELDLEMKIMMKSMLIEFEDDIQFFHEM